MLHSNFQKVVISEPIKEVPEEEEEVKGDGSQPTETVSTLSTERSLAKNNKRVSLFTTQFVQF